MLGGGWVPGVFFRSVLFLRFRPLDGRSILSPFLSKTFMVSVRLPSDVPKGSTSGWVG